jgi:hypothetical protein
MSSSGPQRHEMSRAQGAAHWSGRELPPAMDGIAALMQLRKYFVPIIGPHPPS